MIKITVLNDYNEKVTYKYESITDLYDEYHSNNIDIPSNDNKVISIELEGVRDFDDLMEGNW